MVDKAIPVPIPIRGLNTVTTDIPIGSLYARELTNYSIADGRLKQRPAIGIKNSIDTGTTRYLWFDDLYCIDTAGNIIDFATETTASTISSVNPLATPYIIKHASLELLIGIAQPRLVDYPFTAWTFTTTLTATSITTAVSHKGRLYVSNGATINYSDVGQITGAMPFTYNISQFMNGQTIVYLGSISLSKGNASSENLFFILGNGGKVLIFQGDFPASSTWDLIGDYDMPKVANPQCVLLINGDLFIMADRFAYWASELVSGNAQTAYDNSPTKPIENLWSQQIWLETDTGETAGANHSHVYYHEELDAIVCNCYEHNLKGYFDYNNDQLSFVYFRKYQAWAIWATAPFYAPIRKIDGEYRGTTKGLHNTYLNDSDIDQLGGEDPLTVIGTEEATNSGLDITVSDIATIQAGNILLLSIGSEQGTTIDSYTLPSGFTLISTVGAGSTNWGGLILAYKIATGSEPSSYTTTFPDSARRWACLTGIKGTFTVDSIASGTSSATTYKENLPPSTTVINTSSFVPTTNYQFSINLINRLNVNDGTITLGSGQTLLSDQYTNDSKFIVYITKAIQKQGQTVSNAITIQSANDDIGQAIITRNILLEATTDVTTLKVITSWKTPFIEAFSGRVQRLLGVRPFYSYDRLVDSTQDAEAVIRLVRSVYEYSDYLGDAKKPFYIQASGSYYGLVPDNYSDVSIILPVKESKNYNAFSGLTGNGESVSIQVTSEPLNIQDDVSMFFELYGLTVYIQDGGIFT